MTEPREVTVSDVETGDLWAAAEKGPIALREEYRRLIARRVPNRKPPVEPGTKMSKTFQAQHDGHNACRDKVLKGV